VDEMMKKLQGLSMILETENPAIPQWIGRMGLEWLYVLLVALSL
jgi:UDP-N-acetyl-D-mannosaminuronic acid transferase (WecB/TagA/CpsF family)